MKSSRCPSTAGYIPIDIRIDNRSIRRVHVRTDAALGPPLPARNVASISRVH